MAFSLYLQNKEPVVIRLLIATVLLVYVAGISNAQTIKVTTETIEDWLATDQYWAEVELIQEKIIKEELLKLNELKQTVAQTRDARKAKAKSVKDQQAKIKDMKTWFPTLSKSTFSLASLSEKEPKTQKGKANKQEKIKELEEAIARVKLLLPIALPPLSRRRCETDEIGYFKEQQMEVVQVIDENNMLIKNGKGEVFYSPSKGFWNGFRTLQPHLRDSKWYWISGIDTTNYVDGTNFKPADMVFRCERTESYTAVVGAKKTVKKFGVFDFKSKAAQFLSK